MPLELRKYECPNCGLKIDRDYNSAIVLKAAGMSVLKPVELSLIAAIQLALRTFNPGSFHVSLKGYFSMTCGINKSIHAIALLAEN